MDVEQRLRRNQDQDGADSVPYSDELLVDMVRARENLFDKGRVDYKDEQAKAQAWDGIAAAFGMRVEECQTRWVRLRERFGRELRLHKRGVPPGKEWPLFSRMRWLERFIQPRNRVGGAKAHVAALHAAMVRERHGLGHGLGLGLAALGVAPAPAPAPGPGPAVAAPASSTASDSGDGMAAANEEAAATSGPLWPHTYKLWATAAGDHLQHHAAHHAMEDEDSQQDMAVDLATHASHSSTPRDTPPSDDFHHGPADGALRVPLGGMLPVGPLSSPNDAQDFQDAVRQSLAAVAGSLESMERHLAHGGGPGGGGRSAQPEDPDELFARSLAATLRHLPKSRRSQAKMRLIAVLAEFEDES